MSLKKMYERLAEEWFERCEDCDCPYTDQEMVDFLTPKPKKENDVKREALIECMEQVTGKRVWKKNTDTVDI